MSSASIAGFYAEELVWFLTLFLFGLIVGSFLKVCIYRLPRGKSIVAPPSFCPHCGEFIGWYDNIPLLSYLLLGGKCRACKVHISLRYPLVESLTGLLFGFFFYEFVLREGKPLSVYIAYVALASALIVSSFVDLEFYLIPDEITVWGTVLGPIYSLLFPTLHYSANSLRGLALSGNERIDAVVASLLGILVGGGLILFTALFGSIVFRKEVMGMGDVKLMAMVGGVVGWKLSVIIYFLAPFFALALAIPLLGLEKERKLPYAPFLSIATLVVMSFQRPFVEFFDSRTFILSEVVKGLF
ncbi:MAG TPA: prepilin peptidase [Candidatus Hypogeohydataceae bacterium YC40]